MVSSAIPVYPRRCLLGNMLVSPDGKLRLSVRGAAQLLFALQTTD